MKCPDCKGEKVYIPLIGEAEPCLKCQGEGVVDTLKDMRTSGDPIRQGLHHAWYSAQSFRQGNSGCVYERDNGERIIVSYVTNGLPCNNGWSDLRYCGRVEKWISKGDGHLAEVSQFRDDEDPRK